MQLLCMLFPVLCTATESVSVAQYRTVNSFFSSSVTKALLHYLGFNFSGQKEEFGKYLLSKELTTWTAISQAGDGKQNLCDKEITPRLREPNKPGLICKRVKMIATFLYHLIHFTELFT